jgi:hypothetical protein
VFGERKCRRGGCGEIDDVEDCVKNNRCVI